MTLGEPRVFTAYSVYKGKAALSMKPIPPTFTTSDTSLILKRPGAMLIELAPALGPKVYDWKNKVLFSLDVSECGQFLEKVSQSEGMELLHDPHVGGELAGQVIKKLRLQPMQDNKGLPSAHLQGLTPHRHVHEPPGH